MFLSGHPLFRYACGSAGAYTNIQSKFQMLKHSPLRLLQRVVVLLTVVLLCIGCSNVPSLSHNPWQLFLCQQRPTWDIALADNPNRPG